MAASVNLALMESVDLTRQPSTNLNLHPRRLVFPDSLDELVFDWWWWRKQKRQAQVTTTVLAAVVVILAFDNTTDYLNGGVLTVFLAGRVLPLCIMTAMVCFTPVRIMRMWSIVMTICMSLFVGSMHLMPFLCVDQPSPKPADCAALSEGHIPWLSMAFMLLLPFLLCFGLHTHWEAVAVGCVANFILFAATVLPNVSAESNEILISVLISLVALGCGMSAGWTNERVMRLSFRSDVVEQRKHTAIVQRNMEKLVAQERGQRLYDLIKASDHMMAEYPLEGVFAFVSPGSQKVLGCTPQSLHGTDVLASVHTYDRELVKEALRNLRANPKSTARLEFRRKCANNRYVWVELVAHVVERRFMPATVLGIERVLSKDGHAPRPYSAQQNSGSDGRTMSQAKAMAIYRGAYELRHPLKAVAKLCNAAAKSADGGIIPLLTRAGQSASFGESLLSRLLSTIASKDHAIAILPQRADVRAIVHAVVAAVQPQSPGVPIKVSVSDTVPSNVTTDETRLYQLLMNGLTNAIAAVDDSSESSIDVVVETIELQSLAPGIRYRITDRGHGLGGVDPEPLFDRKPPNWGDDSHAERPLSKQRIGLATCRDLLRAINGAPPPTLTEVSGATTFRFDLPLNMQPSGANVEVPTGVVSSVAIATPGGDKPRAHLPDISRETSRDASRRGTAGAGATASPGARPRTHSSSDPSRRSPAAGKPPTVGMHVLLVDDERVNRRLGARMLQRLGCTYTLLEDGVDVEAALATAAAANRPYDAILMDIIMHHSDGADVCSSLREQGVDIPIIAMTGATGVRDVQRFMQHGFDLVLPKPFDLKAMGTALSEGRERRTRARTGHKSSRKTGSTSTSVTVSAAGAATTTEAGGAGEKSGGTDALPVEPARDPDDLTADVAGSNDAVAQGSGGLETGSGRKDVTDEPPADGGGGSSESKGSEG